LIGINTVKYAYTRSGITAEGLGFAIPIDNVLPIINELIEYGTVARPVLGISLVTVDEYTSRGTGLPTGVLLREVYSGSPAEKAGLRVDDIITHIDGTQIKLFADLKAALNAHAFGDTATLTVFREDKSFEVSVILEQYENPTE
jgi:serine protease Do